MPAITSVHPLRAVEGGRITILGSAFSVDDVTTVQIGETAARVAFAASSRLVVIIPADLERPRGDESSGRHARNRLCHDWHPLGDWTAPGRQPCIRPGRQSFRHLQWAARPGSPGIDIPRDRERHPRIVFVGNRQRDFRSPSARMETSMCPAASRALCTDQERRFARAGGERSGRRVRDCVRRRGIDAGRSIRNGVSCADTAAAEFATIPPALPRSTWQ